MGAGAYAGVLCRTVQERVFQAFALWIIPVQAAALQQQPHTHLWQSGSLQAARWC
jgi:hypothetical protein